jgi:hypothetical protein
VISAPKNYNRITASSNYKMRSTWKIINEENGKAR